MIRTVRKVWWIHWRGGKKAPNIFVDFVCGSWVGSIILTLSYTRADIDTGILTVVKSNMQTYNIGSNVTRLQYCFSKNVRFYPGKCTK